MNLLDLAAVALAQFEGAPAEPPPVSGIRCRDWLLHFTDREPLEVIFSDDLTSGEVLATYPAAVAAARWQEPTTTPQPTTEPAPAAADPFPVLPTCNGVPKPCRTR